MEAWPRQARYPALAQGQRFSRSPAFPLRTEINPESPTTQNPIVIHSPIPRPPVSRTTNKDSSFQVDRH